MSLNLAQKKAVITKISQQLQTAQTIVLAEYRGIEVVHLTQLRAKAREEGVYLHVLKNTLVRRAVEGTVFSSLVDYMSGPLLYSISSDPIAPARVIHDFAKTNEKIILKAGSYAGKLLDSSALQVFASIPSRDVLLAQFAGLLMSPVAAFARGIAALASAKEASPTT